MTSIKKAALIAALALACVASAIAESKKVLVVYNGQTQVNREAYNFIRRNLNDLKVAESLSATTNAKGVKAGDYMAIVVLSTGVAPGAVDPALKSIIDAYPNKSDIFLVDMPQGRADTTVAQTAAKDSANKVDTVTSASVWSEGANKTASIKIHQQWVALLADFIKSK
jgi:hypothetical protein